MGHTLRTVVIPSAIEVAIFLPKQEMATDIL